MKTLTTKKLFAGAMSLGVLGLLALPVIVGATGSTDAGAVPQIGDFSQTLGDATLTGLIQSVIQVILSFLGVIAVLIMLWGGFIWMTAAGEPDKVDKAKKMIYSGIIGLVIIFAAYAIANFVMTRLIGITGADLGGV